ncbi:DUF4382 domain-containing protein [Aquifex sp.]
MKGKKALLAGAIFVSSILAYNCGGGGGGGTTTTPTTSTTPLNVYVTDAPPANLTAFEVMLYSIDLCTDDQCTESYNVFSNPDGVAIDLTNLEGTLLYLDTSSVPTGVYTAARVEFSQTATAVIDGTPETYTISCPTNTDGNCEYIVTGINLDTTQSDKLVLDINLSQATFDEATKTVTDLIVRTVDPQQMQTTQYKYEVYGRLQSVNGNQFTFTWRNKEYTAEIGQNTVCELEVNGQEAYYIGAECADMLPNVTPGTCLELKLMGDPAQTSQLQNVIKLETTHPKKCGIATASTPSDYYKYYEYERYVDLNAIDFTNGTVQLTADTTCNISDRVYCEIDDMYEEDKYLVGKENCLPALQGFMNGNTVMTRMRVEVKYRLYQDENGQQQCEVYKIEVDDWDDDYYEYNYDNYNDNYTNMNENDNVR